MYTELASSHHAADISRRALLQMGLADGLTGSALPLSRPATLWGTDARQPKRAGILCVRSYDATHFDHHLKEVGIETEMKIQEYGAYMATTAQGKYAGMVYGPITLTTTSVSAAPRSCPLAWRLCGGRDTWLKT